MNSFVVKAVLVVVVCLMVTSAQETGLGDRLKDGLDNMKAMAESAKSKMEQIKDCAAMLKVDASNFKPEDLLKSPKDADMAKLIECVKSKTT